MYRWVPPPLLVIISDVKSRHERLQDSEQAHVQRYTPHYICLFWGNCPMGEDRPWAPGCVVIEGRWLIWEMYLEVVPVSRNLSTENPFANCVLRGVHREGIAGD